MAQPFPTLFSPLTIRGKTLKNRIFSTGHMTVMIRDGQPTDQMVAYHEARAKGGAGLIILEAARAHPTGDSGRAAIRAYDPACIPGYARIVAACHKHGCAVFAQLSHPGREMPMMADGTHAVALAPSAVPNERFHVMPREMSIETIRDVIDGYRVSAANLAKAGLDGVEVVASHGYLLSQFLNPRLNRRADEYGDGTRFVREVIEAVRKGAGQEMIVGLRISGDEPDHQGLELDEVLGFLPGLAATGLLDYLNVAKGTSAGLAGSTHIVPPMFYEAAYTAPLAAAIRAKVDIPVFVAGRINQPQIAEDVLTTGQADMCAMTRALIADPLMPAKAEAGQLDDIRACIACNQACIGHMLNGVPISCIQHPETGREETYGTLTPTDAPRRIMVAGGGPAGMKAAAIAAARGHHVTLYEAASALGGQAILAQSLPGRAEFGGIITNLAHEMKRAGVDVHLNTPVTADLVRGVAPDVLLMATGATPYESDIEGADEAHVVTAWQVLKGEANVGSRAVIADWRCDWIGMGLAEKLARDGCHVRLCVNGMVAGQSLPQYVRDTWLGTLHKLGVEITPHLRLFGADEDSAYFQHTLSGEPVIMEDTDTLVTAIGHASDHRLSMALVGWPGEVHQIGDALAPRTAEEAVLDGLRAAWAL